MICLVCPKCKKANLRAEPIIKNDICDNCGSKLIPCECLFCKERKKEMMLKQLVENAKKAFEVLPTVEELVENFKKVSEEIRKNEKEI